nr:hypothetical protein CFP56_53292 [Quercus suber]
MEPAAAVAGKTVYPSIYDFPNLSKLVENFGLRILWERRHADQFSSYTNSLVFAFVHAMLRKVKGETEITISCLDTDKVRTKDGGEVEFYHVPELQRILRVADWKHWLPKQYCKLVAPWYSHEYVVHGSIELGEEPFRMVPLEDFEQAGIRDFLPGLYDDLALSDMTRLYSRCVEMRMNWHGWAVPAPFRVSHLDHAARLAKLFIPHDVSTLGEHSLVRSLHFQIFADFVGLSRIEGNRAVFEQYVQNHFTGKSPGTFHQMCVQY